MKALTLLVSIDAIFYRRPSPGDAAEGCVAVGGDFFYMGGEYASLLRLLCRRGGGRAVRGAGRRFRVVIYSSLGVKTSTRLVRYLASRVGLESNDIELLGLSGVTRHANWSDGRIDIFLWDNLLRMGVNLGRLVVLDRGASGCLDACRFAPRGRDDGAVVGHLRRLSRTVGDLRARDINRVREKPGRYEWVWAGLGPVLRDLPPSVRARRPGESLLLLDLDETLVHTDVGNPMVRRAAATPASAPGGGIGSVGVLDGLLGLPPESVPGREGGDGAGGEGAGGEGAGRGYDYLVAPHWGGWARPGLLGFMAEVRGLFDRVAVYTAGTEDYALEVLGGVLPPGLMPDFILSRSHTGRVSGAGYVKSIEVAGMLGYEKKRVILVDNRPDLVVGDPDNVVAIKSYTGEGDDRGLASLLRLLRRIARARDFTRVAKYFVGGDFSG